MVFQNHYYGMSSNVVKVMKQHLLTRCKLWICKPHVARICRRIILLNLSRPLQEFRRFLNTKHIILFWLDVCQTGGVEWRKIQKETKRTVHKWCQGSQWVKWVIWTENNSVIIKSATVLRKVKCTTTDPLDFHIHGSKPRLPSLDIIFLRSRPESCD